MSSDSLPGIKNKPHVRFLVLLAYLLHRKFPPLLRAIAPGAFFKVKGGTNLNEAESLQFVAAHTSIPVPKVYSAFVYNAKSYIVMARITGRPLCNCWNTLSENDIATICAQLKGYMDELRSIKPPQPGKVGSVNYGKLLGLPLSPYGPFDTVQDFRRHLSWGLTNSRGDPNKQELLEAMDKGYPTCFSHCDLNASNILIKSGRIVSIIDWEMAGWYPVYWEYVQATNIALFEPWPKKTDMYLDPYTEERTIEDLRQKIYPNPL